MRTIWTALCVLAVANLLAIGGLVGWLRSSGRLDMDRVREMRVLLTKTIADEKAEAQQAQAAVEAAKKQAEADAKAKRVPLTASEQLAARLEATELDEQRVKSMRSEVESLQRTIKDAQEKIKADRVALDKERQAFESIKKAQGEQAKNEQFQKTLAILQSMKPAEARSMLSELMVGSPPASGSGSVGASGTAMAGEPTISNPPSAPPSKGGREQVVAYLDAMEAKPRSKIMSEFLKADPKLAAELLEELRQRGQIASAAGKPGP